MAIRHYLAMTGSEFRSCRALPRHTGWLGCHFSPYGPGLSNLPPPMPPDSLVILDDITPIRGHDPEMIAAQLKALLEQRQFRALLLDFQRPGYSEAAALAEHLVSVLPCPVGVSADYAQAGGAVFLPPVPLHSSLAEHLALYPGWEIWLDTSPAGEILTLTADGAAISPAASPPAEGFSEEKLHMHYRIETEDAAARFTLWRTQEDSAALLREAEVLGVTLAVGLYQEWGTPGTEDS